MLPAVLRGLRRAAWRWAWALCTALLAVVLLHPATAAETEAEVPLTGLTAAERSWLAAHPVLRLGANPSAPPFTVIDRGQHRGIDADIMRLLAAKLGVRFEPVAERSWDQIQAMARAGEVDLLSLLPPAPERAAYLNFSDPVTEIEYALFVRSDGPSSQVPDLAGRRVAVVGSFAVRRWIERDYPGVVIVPTTSALEALTRLSTGEADAAVSSIGGASVLIRDKAIVNLRLQQVLYRPPLAVGVRKDWPELVTILNKAIAQIDPREIDRIKSRHIAVTSGGYTREQVLIAVLATALLALAAILALVARAFRQARAWAALQLRSAEALATSNRQLQDQIAAREHSENQYRLLFENSLDGVLQTRPDGTILAANPVACRLFGMTEAELQATGRRAVVVPSDPRLRALLAERERHGRVAGVLSMRRADGSQFEAEISSAVYTDTAGQLLTSMLVRDITERVQAEESRRALEAQLRQAQKMEAIGTLAGGIAHDFNNILGAILGNVALAQQDLAQGQTAQQALAQIARAGERARGLVEQILAFSRQQPTALRVQPLAPLIAETVGLLRATLPSRVRLDLALPEAPLYVDADATQMQQVVMNLCTNAWHALNGSSGHIAVRLEPLQVPAPGGGAAPPGLLPGSYAHLSVRDDGCGMDAATRARIFEPFFTTKPSGEGTGLGLSVVHGIVAGHHGVIEVQSQPGAGATFDVYLPTVAAPAASDGEVPAVAAAPAGQGERVLVIDDDEVMLLMVERLLQRSGYHVTSFGAPRDALASVRARPDAYDVVVTDFNMPEMSGLEVAAALREIRPDLPVVLSSGFISDQLRADAQAAGVQRLLRKERTLEEIGAAIAAALRRSA